jgi:hypothetical protein
MKTISAITLIMACLVAIPASGQQKGPLAGYEIHRGTVYSVDEVKLEKFKLAKKIFRFEAQLNVASNPVAIAPGVYRTFLGSVEKDYINVYIDSEKGLKYFKVARKSKRTKNFWAAFRGGKLYLVGRTVRDGVVGW